MAYPGYLSILYIVLWCSGLTMGSMELGSSTTPASSFPASSSGQTLLGAMQQALQQIQEHEQNQIQEETFNDELKRLSSITKEIRQTILSSTNLPYTTDLSSKQWIELNDAVLTVDGSTRNLLNFMIDQNKPLRRLDEAISTTFKMFIACYNDAFIERQEDRATSGDILGIVEKLKESLTARAQLSAKYLAVGQLCLVSMRNLCTKWHALTAAFTHTGTLETQSMKKQLASIISQHREALEIFV